MKKVILSIVIATTISSCGAGERMRLNAEGKIKADNVIENLVSPAVVSEFPIQFFTEQNREQFLGSIRTNCDWKNRKGKYVDFYGSSHTQYGNSTAFIYEYFLDCDSLRFMLHYKMVNDEPTLWMLNAEPLEVKSKMIIDPSKQLIPQ